MLQAGRLLWSEMSLTNQQSEQLDNRNRISLAGLHSAQEAHQVGDVLDDESARVRRAGGSCICFACCSFRAGPLSRDGES